MNLEGKEGPFHTDNFNLMNANRGKYTEPDERITYIRPYDSTGAVPCARIDSLVKTENELAFRQTRLRG